MTKVFTEEDLRNRITKIRNLLYDKMPTGDVSAWDMIKLVKEHLSELDDFISSLVGTEQEREQQINERELQEIAEVKYPRTFYDGTLTLDDKNYEIKRKAFIEGFNFSSISQGEGKEQEQ